MYSFLFLNNNHAKCCITALLWVLSNLAQASTPAVTQLCQEVGSLLGSVSVKQCLQQQLDDSSARSTEGRALVTKQYPPVGKKKPLGRVLVMGGIHGDEYSSVSLMFRWMETLNQYHSGLFHWHWVPLLNPDGLLATDKATRQNANGVDLNRNFPTPDWLPLAQKYWIERTHRNPRRFPGAMASSERETQWFIEQIRAFKPDAIVAVHAPHKLVDFDGPQNPPTQLGNLQLRRLGTYPGSLGNYGGSLLNIPVVTVELPSAGIMPSKQEVSRMWVDLVRWLRTEIPKQQANTDSDSNKTQKLVQQP